MSLAQIAISMAPSYVGLPKFSMETPLRERDISVVTVAVIFKRLYYVSCELLSEHFLVRFNPYLVLLFQPRLFHSVLKQCQFSIGEYI